MEYTKGYVMTYEKIAYPINETHLYIIYFSVSYYAEEVPMRWNVNGFLDNFGSACFDGNCSTNEPMQHDKGSVPVPSLPEAVALEPKQRMKVLKGIEDTACETPVQSCVRESTEQKADTQSIEERRETLRLNIIEKIWNLVKRPEDIPDALTYVDRVNLQITGIEKGSLLFKVMVNTLDDLERLQKLVIYGGMKKILDQELIEKHMGVSILFSCLTGSNLAIPAV